MEEIRQLAFASVARAVLFIYSAIGLLLLALSYDPHLALQAGGSASLAISVIFIQRAFAVEGADPRQNEVWSMLAMSGRASGDRERMRFLADVLSLTYLQFARLIAGVAASFFGAAVLFALIG